MCMFMSGVGSRILDGVVGRYLTSRFLRLLEVGIGRGLEAVVVVGVEGDAGVRDDVISG